MKARSFVAWFLSEPAKTSRLVGITTLLGWFITLFLFLFTKLNPSITTAEFDGILKSPQGLKYRGILAAIQAVICGLLAMLTPRPKNLDEGGGDVYITKKASERIHSLVISLFMSLALLYAVYAFFAFKPQAQIFPDSAGTWSTVFEILTATLIFFLYVELAAITVEPNQKPSSVRSSADTPVGSLPGDAHRHRLLFFWFALGLVILCVLSFYFPSTKLQTGIRVAVACLSGVTLAMVVGRLGSPYLNPGTGTLFFLYLYAVIQPFAAFFPRPTMIFILTSVALPLKVLLWLVFVWAFTTGKLGEYVQEIRCILERQDANSKVLTSG